MPEIRNDGVVSFVHGHGAQFFSNAAAGNPAANHHRPLSADARERARLRAAAQLAFQRSARRLPVKREGMRGKDGTAGWT